MVFYGEWRGDSTPFWALGTIRSDGALPSWTQGSSLFAATRSTKTHSRAFGEFRPRADDPVPAAQAVFSGAGSSVAAEPGIAGAGQVTFQQRYVPEPVSPGDNPWYTLWENVYATVSRADGQTTFWQDVANLPPDVYDPDIGFLDPNVIGVEWQAAPPAPIAHRLKLAIESYGYVDPTNADQSPQGVNFYAFAVPETVPPETDTPDAFYPVNAIVSSVGDNPWIPIGSVPGTAPEGMVGREAVYESPFDAGVDTPLRIRITALDDVTAAQSSYPVVFGDAAHEWGVEFTWSARLEQQYQPAFRLAYAVEPVTTTPAVTRLFPRDDALGLSSAPRLVPPPKGRRVVGGYI